MIEHRAQPKHGISDALVKEAAIQLWLLGTIPPRYQDAVRAAEEKANERERQALERFLRRRA